MYRAGHGLLLFMSAVVIAGAAVFIVASLMRAAPPTGIMAAVRPGVMATAVVALGVCTCTE